MKLDFTYLGHVQVSIVARSDVKHLGGIEDPNPQNQVRGEPAGDGGRSGDHAIGVRVAIGEKEVEDDVEEEGDLAGDVEEEEVLREAAEEAELHGREEGGVYRPQEYELRPYLVPPAPPSRQP